MSLPSFNVSLNTLVVLISLLWFLNIISEAAPTYRFHYCSNETTFTPNSTYQSNLNLLLSSLSSNATNQSGFYNTTVGQNPSNMVYGLFLCRGDVTTEVCHDCVATAIRNRVQQNCSMGKVAVIWYDECMLRYSNQSFFSIMDEWPTQYVSDNQSMPEVERFNKLLATMIDDLVTQATSAQPNAKKFATKEANFSASLTLYSLVQCTPDLSSFGCTRCIRQAVADLQYCCVGKQGAMVLYPTCVVRYEIYPFYRIIPSPPPPPPPAPAGSVTRTKNGKGNDHRFILPLHHFFHTIHITICSHHLIF